MAQTKLSNHQSKATKTGRAKVSAFRLGSHRTLAMALLTIPVAALASGSADLVQKPGKAAPPVTGPVGTHVYNLHPLNDDKVFTNPSNQWSYYFEVKPEMELYPDQSTFELDYAVAATLIPGQGAITIFLNGYPLSSRVLPPAPGDTIPWKVSLPDKYIKKGFNEIKIVDRQKTSVGHDCTEVDNPANWFRINKTTSMHLVRKDPATFPLSLYPFPYLDSLEDNAVRCHWMVPSNPSIDTLAAMLDTASDWGKRLPSNGLPINVATRASGSPSGSVLMISANPGWSTKGPSNLADGVGALFNFSATGQPGASSLYIEGNGAKGLDSARRAIATPEMTRQMAGTQSIINVPPVREDIPPTTRLGSFSFTDLGLPAIHLAGAFHQKASLTIRRPLRCDLGRESYIKLKFRHSASMNPLRSLITVELNGVPIGSAKLEPENANDGIIRARIPVEELMKNFWVLDIKCFHDLGAVDCQKNYDEVAWTVIEGESTFELINGNLIGRPYLESFPYLIPSDGRIPDSIDFGFSPNPSDEQLTLAAAIAGRAAQTNRITLNWTTSKGEKISDKKGGIVVGYYDEVARFAPFKDLLLVCPLGNGKFFINKNVQLMADTLVGGAVIQAVSLPGTKSGVLYVVMAQDNDALNMVTKIMSDPNKADTIGGQVCIITKEGRVVPLKVQGAGDKRALEIAKQSYTLPMTIAMVVVVVGLLIAMVWVGSRFVKRGPAAQEDDEDSQDGDS